MAAASPDSDFRILLIGRTGHGKSSTGNTIAGKKIFEVSDSAKSLTKTCEWSKKIRRFDKIVEVVDTPGLFDTDLDHITVKKELLKALALTTPGFHAIAFVLLKGRFTEEIQKTQDLFFEWFGPGVEDFACVILTDTKTEQEKNRYIYNDPPQKLAHLVKTCNDNVVPLDNLASDKTKDRQVRRLFDVVESIKQRNKNEHFTNLAFQLAMSYAVNKFPKELTMDSILLLNDAGLKMKLSENTCRYNDQIVTLSQQKDTTHHSTAIPVINETSEDERTQTRGNLRIFDNSTNERLSNTPNGTPDNAPDGTPDNAPDGTPDNTPDGTPDNTPDGTPDNTPDGTPDNTPDGSPDNTPDGSPDNTPDGTADNTPDGSPDNTPDGSSDNTPDGTPDNTPASPIDEFKTIVNEDENSEKILSRLLGFFRKALNFCKRNVPKCARWLKQLFM